MAREPRLTKWKLIQLRLELAATETGAEQVGRKVKLPRREEGYGIVVLGVGS